ncbi:hypothetical protein [Streptomyces sp. NRRL S-448]|uniref:hypothetical protein n=1 Tax=Streptomyces sp. NRRL S-448 TaxID=1463907 RepID=UPI003565E810
MCSTSVHSNQEAAGSAPAVLEVHLLEALVGDVTQLLLVRPGVLGIEEAGGELGRQRTVR